MLAEPFSNSRRRTGHGLVLSLRKPLRAVTEASVRLHQICFASGCNSMPRSDRRRVNAQHRGELTGCLRREPAPIPMISRVVASCSRSAHTLSSQPSTRCPICAATTPTTTSVSREAEAEHQNRHKAQHDAPSGQRRQQDRQRGRVRQYPARNTECYQHRKARPFSGYQIESMRVLGAPAVAVPDHAPGIIVRMIRSIVLVVVMVMIGRRNDHGHDRDDHACGRGHAGE